MKNKNLHPKNVFNKGYDFDELIIKNPALTAFVSKDKFNALTIDFASPNAVKELNKALLCSLGRITSWSFPKENLCPPIPGRLDYMHYLADLLSPQQQAKILDIGTGATCIYPLLGVSAYDWDFVGTDIDVDSLIVAQTIIDDNKLTHKIKLRKQRNKESILQGIILDDDSFAAVVCNPPFYKSATEAQDANDRKSKNLGNEAVRNFAGNHNELWCSGGEKAFLHNYLYESSLHKKASQWFTSLVSKKDNVKSLEASAKKLGATEYKVIPMHQGNKVTRIVAWRF